MLNFDLIAGQIRQVSPKAVLRSSPENEDDKYPIDTLYLYPSLGEKPITILSVVEDNITWRIRNYLKDALWSIRGVKDPDLLLSQRDLVLVSYGPAAEHKEIWKESKGNDRCGSFRRIDYTKRVVRYNEVAYREIPYTFTEKNIMLMLERLPMEDLCDYSNSRD